MPSECIVWSFIRDLKLGKLWRNYKYHLDCQIAEIETIEEIEERLRGVSET